MLDAYWIRQRVDELRVAFVFLTRLPLLDPGGHVRGELARALWGAPLVGVAIGLVGAVVYGLAHALHVPALPAAALAVAATLLSTGALHEDGLADVADGFGGGTTRERKLEIMRDSRIGSYGVIALTLSIVLRVGALASLSDAASVAAALIAAHAIGRAGLPAFMRLVPPARADGMSAGAGTPPPESALGATLVGAIIAFIALGLAAGLVALLLVAGGFAVMAWLCSKQIQGQTGDVLGALEQVGEIAVLLVAAAAMS
jgi:adenosylcobinamide-GDP ribazoletransferase